jgi:hypothetical protein
MKMSVAPAPHLRRVGLLITIASVMAIAFATLSPEPGVAVGSHLCLVCGSLGGLSAILNVFLFLPLGIGLSLCGVPGKRALVGMLGMSVLIETAQFLAIPGRNSTIGDVLTNALGGALGFAIGRYSDLWLRPPPQIARNLAVGWAAIWLAAQAISSFNFTLSLPDSPYYGQIARVLGNYAVFRGLVLTASVGDVQIPNTALADSRSVQRLLLDGATVMATVVPAEPTCGIAPIVRVADTRQREILLLAQDGEKLIVGVRTGAAVLRLRPPFFALSGAFPAMSPDDSSLTTDTLTVAGRYSPREVRVSVRTARASLDRRIPIAPSLGWTMLMPLPWLIEGTPTELVLSGIWIAGLLLPVGYWGAGVARLSRAQESTRIGIATVAIGLVLLYVGLVVVPRAFGLTAAPPSDWLAALTAILFGGALAPRVSAQGAKAAHTD